MGAMQLGPRISSAFMIYLTTVTSCRLTCASNSFPVWQTFNGSHNTKPCEMSCGTVKFMLDHFINKPYTSSSTPFNFNLTLSPLYPEGISSSFLSTDNTSTGVCVQYNNNHCMIADLTDNVLTQNWHHLPSEVYKILIGKYWWIGMRKFWFIVGQWWLCYREIILA